MKHKILGLIVGLMFGFGVITSAQIIVSGGGSGGSGATLGTNTFTGTQTISISNITANPGMTLPTTANALYLVNPTSAVSTDQYSPSLTFCADASGTANPTCYVMAVAPDNSLGVYAFLNGASTPHNQVAAFTSNEGFRAGTLTGSNVSVNFLSYANNVETDTSSINEIVTYGVSSGKGVRSLYDTTDTLKIKAYDGTDAATLDVKTFSSGGTVGVSCTVGTLNPATAVITGGVITHC